MVNSESTWLSYAYIVAIMAALNSCNLGYDIGIITAVAPILQDQTQFGVSDVQLELFIGLVDVAAVLGVIMCGFIADMFGRRACMFTSEILFVVGVMGMTYAQDYGALLFFRLITGSGIGMGLTIGPMYISEVAPSNLRGKLVSFCEIAIIIGVEVGYICGYSLSGLPNDTSWRVMLGLGAVMPLVMLVCLVYMPETPRWLILNDREVEAREVIAKVHENDATADALEIAIREAVEAEDEKLEHGSWQAILYPSAAVKHALYAGIGIAIIQQITGIEVIGLYFMYLLDHAGISDGNEYAYLISIGAVRIAVVIWASIYFDDPSVGRRPMLLLSGAGIAVSVCLLSVFYALPASTLVHVLLVGTLMLFFSSYAVGYGPLTWVIMSEVFPLQIRAKAMMLTNIVNRAIPAVLSGTFLSAVDWMGYAQYFLLITLVSIFSVVYIYYIVPETGGMKLESISSVFGHRHSFSSLSGCSSGDDTNLDGETQHLLHRHRRTVHGENEEDEQ